MNPLDLIFWAVLLAFSAVGLTVITRNTPFIRNLYLEAKKPWACNVCMSLWSSLFVVPLPVVVMHDGRYAALFLPVYTATLLILDAMARPPGPPSIPAEFFKENP